MAAQWVLSGLVGGGSVYALDITAPGGATQIIFVTSFPDGGPLTQADADSLAEGLAAAVRALPASCTLTAVTFDGMTLAQLPGAIPVDLVYPAATWANYAAALTLDPAAHASAGMITASPADGVLTAATLAGLAAGWAGAAAALPGVTGPVTAVLQVIAPASVI